MGDRELLIAFLEEFKRVSRGVGREGASEGVGNFNKLDRVGEDVLGFVQGKKFLDSWGDISFSSINCENKIIVLV